MTTSTNVTGILAAEGQRWERSHDGINLVEEVDPLGHTTEYAYDKNGLPVEITDAKGGKKQMAYNAAGQLTAYTDGVIPFRLFLGNTGERERTAVFGGLAI